MHFCQPTNQALLLLLFLLPLPTRADVLKPTPVNERIARQTGHAQAKGYFIPQTSYLLTFGDYDPVTETSYLWIFQRHHGHYRLWRQMLVEGEWRDNDLSCYPLQAGSHTRIVLASTGSTLRMLAFPDGLGQPPEFLSLYAGNEASPWAVPAYDLKIDRGRLIIESCFDTPDGREGGKPEFEWTGRGWDRIPDKPGE